MSNTSKGLKKVETLTIKEDRETKGRYARHNGLIHLDGNLKKAKSVSYEASFQFVKSLLKINFNSHETFLTFRSRHDMENFLGNDNVEDEAGLKRVG